MIFHQNVILVVRGGKGEVTFGDFSEDAAVLSAP